ncbi:MAG: hypothetical protein KJ638_00725, partial [Chloroflexi bacterium]|nr:hypothetical protein [Chloroflexota bacterium]
MDKRGFFVLCTGKQKLEHKSYRKGIPVGIASQLFRRSNLLLSEMEIAAFHCVPFAMTYCLRYS